MKKTVKEILNIRNDFFGLDKENRSSGSRLAAVIRTGSRKRTIMAAVPFRGAVEIFVIERKERRNAVPNLLRRFRSISIRKKEG